MFKTIIAMQKLSRVVSCANGRTCSSAACYITLQYDCEYLADPTQSPLAWSKQKVASSPSALLQTQREAWTTPLSWACVGENEKYCLARDRLPESRWNGCCPVSFYLV